MTFLLDSDIGVAGTVQLLEPKEPPADPALVLVEPTRLAHYQRTRHPVEGAKTNTYKR